MLDEIKRIADKYFKPYEIKRGEKGKGRYWVDIITADLSLGTLDSARARATLDGFTAELAEQFNIDRSKVNVWTLKENEIVLGFFLPYHRVLSPSDVEHKFIIVEAEFRDYFPPIGVRFFVLGGVSVYEASLDEHSRIFLTKWFNDHPRVKPGDTAIIWALNPFNTYALTLRK
jgi:hypothetical protein